jgi:hypothetical protein
MCKAGYQTLLMLNGTFRKRVAIRFFAAILIFSLAVLAAYSQRRMRTFGSAGDRPEAEFHMVRLVYGGAGLGGFRGFFNSNWWAIDYPEAEEHFLPALRRVTNMSVAEDSVHLEITDDRIFQYPLIFMQQPGQSGWRPSEYEASRMREYLQRGGFMMVDDFHGEYEWTVFESAMKRVLPDNPIVDIPDDDPLLHVFYDLDKRTQIPGRRHLRFSRSGGVFAQMEGAPRWRAIYDSHGRIMVAINFNMDMGDAWEHADDPDYPTAMTGLAYRFGINYVIYAMSH